MISRHDLYDDIKRDSFRYLFNNNLVVRYLFDMF